MPGPKSVDTSEYASFWPIGYGCATRSASGQERTQFWTGSGRVVEYQRPDHLLPYARSEEASSESDRESNQSIML